MHIIHDFFLLVWQKDVKQKFTSAGDIESYLNTIYKSQYDIFCDFTTILLCVSPANLDRFGEIDLARDAMRALSGLDEWDKDRVQYIQKELLFFLKTTGNSSLCKAIQQRFDKMRKNSIIGYDMSRKLISLLALIENKEEKITPVHIAKAKQGANFYESALNTLCTAAENLELGVEDVLLRERLELVPQKLRESKFSIGVTGVMNAGKSTLLNALLGSEILGTSVVPETANLTIIKYAKQPSARVNFWTKAQWESIEKSAQRMENMRHFVEYTKEHFKDTMHTYITADGLSHSIDIDKLPAYTSAEHSDAKCNLVKSVELFSDLKFVQNGVEIVDTPGLDDPIIQREEITKEYLYECDLMIHLMNVNQSATQKDIEFITDTLLYHNVVRLLIVITRIDTVSPQELKEVIDFTKSSIKSHLQALNKEAQFSNIIEKIDFIPIAGKMALMHKIGQEQDALLAGYSLERTGLPQIEAYLEEVLFGDDSQKAHLIVAASKKEILSIVKSARESFSVEQSLLGKSATEIENEYTRNIEQFSLISANIDKLNTKIEDAKHALEEFFVTLENLLANKLLSLQALIKRRVVDDVSYELRKNKKKPADERISYIIEAGIKDGFIDVLRDYRYTFEKQMIQELDKIAQDYEGFSGENPKNADPKTFFTKYFEQFHLASGNTILIQESLKTIKESSLSKIEAMDQALQILFAQAFKDLHYTISQKLALINQELIEYFILTCKAPIETKKSQMQEKKRLIKEAKERIDDRSFDAKTRLLQIEQKMLVLDKVVEQLGQLGEEA